MKLLNMIIIFVCGAHSASCQQIEEMSYELAAEAVDEQGKPLEGIQVITGRLEVMGGGTDIMAKPVTTKPVSTDAHGKAIIRFKSLPEPEGNMSFYQDGYYSTRQKFEWTRPDGFDGKTREAAVKAILKPIKNPIPMIARKDIRIRTPKFNVVYGFDLEMGESLPPLGNGKNADIEFILSGSRKDLGYEEKEHIDFKMIIRCPNPDDGFVEFLIDDSLEFGKGSVLPSGHECPETGYVNSLFRHYRNDNDGGMVESHRIRHEDRNKCAYFRISTRKDQSGKITSAHYGKIYGPLEIRPAFKQHGHYDNTAQGGFFMQYTYFNPTANDRNVEFDPCQNLLPGGNITRP
jgi:hypothetical protein